MFCISLFSPPYKQHSPRKNQDQRKEEVEPPDEQVLPADFRLIEESQLPGFAAQFNQGSIIAKVLHKVNEEITVAKGYF